MVNDKVKCVFYICDNDNTETIQKAQNIESTKNENRDILSNDVNSDYENLYTVDKTSVDKIMSIVTSENDNDVTKGILSNLDDNSTSLLRDNNTVDKEKIEIDFEAMITSMLRNEDFECGISNQSENYFNNCLMKNRDDTLNKLLLSFVNNFHSNNAHIVVGFLHIISHFKYEQVYPTGQSIAIMSLSYNDSEVQEYAIKCFENWGNIDGIKKLEAVKYTDKWLDDYAQSVIEDLKTR